jgi:uncharacterized integral membrane protein (TIGR00698 family)
MPLAFVASIRSTPEGVSSRRLAKTLAAIAPGLLLCAAVSLAAIGLQGVEQRLFGRAWLESLVLAILVGTLVRTVWAPSALWCAGIGFSARTVLEVAVMLLGVAVSASTLMAVGWPLLIGIVAIVFVSIGVSFGLGTLFGLPRRMALLVACGNSICGNSAIAAVAPVIGAQGKDVAAAIAFTALLGVATVIGLPLLGGALHLGGIQYGVLAGLTVYAVPQVLAAAAPAGAAAVQIGTLVKLVRVLMLGPVCFAASMLARRWALEDGGAAAGPTCKPSIYRLVPWFILGFVALAALRSLGAIPAVAIRPAGEISAILTVVSMAALGLSTDLRSVAKAGPRVAGAVTVSLAGLGAISLGLVYLLWR